MKHYYFSSIQIITILFISCKKQQTISVNSQNETNITENTLSSQDEEPVIFEHYIDSTKLGLNYKPKGNYTTILQQIQQQRSKFKTEYVANPETTIDSVSHYFTQTLLNDIIPHWYHTTWAYEGHTNIPNDGEIACGYFVSTTLKHFGFNLNRYKMAQQAGLNEALSLQEKAKLNIFRNVTYDSLKEKLLKKSEGLYFVGLSNHVGYLLIKDKELYFIHSSYCDYEVVIELAEHSYCFESDIYVIADLSNNKPLLKKWLFNERIPIVQ